MLSIEDYFTYHPTQTVKREQAHKAINQSALRLAQALDVGIDSITNLAIEMNHVINELVEDEVCRHMAFEMLDSIVKIGEHKTALVFAVQQTRMFANQGATIDELKMLRGKEKETEEGSLGKDTVDGNFTLDN